VGFARAWWPNRRSFATPLPNGGKLLTEVLMTQKEDEQFEEGTLPRATVNAWLGALISLFSSTRTQEALASPEALRLPLLPQLLG
jgi:hypothetical protein